MYYYVYEDMITTADNPDYVVVTTCGTDTLPVNSHFSQFTYAQHVSDSNQQAMYSHVSFTNNYYYGHRFYHPETGRWLSRDPIEEIGFLVLSMKEWPDADTEESSYMFVFNSPMNVNDGFGLYCGSGWNEWLVPDNPGGFPFGSPCKNHDDCYGCEGYKAAKTKVECDQQFLKEMKEVCSSQPVKVKAWCTRRSGGRGSRSVKYRCWKYPRSNCEWWADTYYWAVDRLGQGPFNKARKSCCAKPDKR